MNKLSMKKVLYLNIVLMAFFTLALRMSIHQSNFLLNLVALLCFYAFALVLIPFVVYKSDAISGYVNHVSQVIKNVFQDLKTNWKHALLILGIYAVLAAISVAICGAFSAYSKTEFVPMYSYMIIGIVYIIFTTYLLRKSISDKPEKLFFSILMISGICYVLASPNNVGIVWDEGIHFFRVESVAQFFNAEGIQADADELYLNPKFFDYVSKDTRIEFDNSINISAEKRVDVDYSYGFFSIAYVGYAVGITIARALLLPFSICYKIAKIINLAFYGMIIYYAMKKLKAGKILVATIALIPTMQLMAGAYSYDQWVLSFTIYGFCYFLSFLQDKEKKLRPIDEWLMIGSFVLGCIPKAIYFVLMFPFLFLPRTAFNDKKQHRKYILHLMIAVFILLVVIITPMLMGGASGDSRGGSDVNSMQQIMFILHNPMRYMEILANFLFSYLHPNNGVQIYQNYAYFGFGKFGVLTMILIGVVALLDKTGEKTKNGWIWFSSILGTFVAIVLTATALYVSFTAVGKDWIEGCQFRYIIAVLFPFLYMITSDKVENHMNKFWFNSIPMIFMGITFLYNVMSLIASKY